MMLPAHPMPRPTAQVAPFFDMLGAELTVQFLLQFGGAELYLSNDLKGRSAVEAVIGPDRLKALATSDHRALQKRVPLAKPWLAAMLHWQGHSTAHIARTLRATDVTVRGWVKGKAR